MKILSSISALLLAVALCISPVYADQPTGQLAPAIPFQLNTTTQTTIKATGGILYAIIALGTQTHAITCFDNASALSGTQLSNATMSLTVVSLLLYGPNGIQFTNGLTCQIPTAVVAPGVLILYN
jgi:hypothetical protein